MKRKGWGILTPGGDLLGICSDDETAAQVKAEVYLYGGDSSAWFRWKKMKKQGWRSVKVMMEVDE